MVDIKKILVPVDFSDLSVKALEIADNMASVFNAKVTPVHVHIPVTELDEPYAFSMSSSIYTDYEKVEANLKKRLQEIAGGHIDESRLEEPVVTFGNAAQSIVDISPSFDCIVMSTHGRTGFSRLLLGSVAGKVLRLAHIPVMVVEDDSNVRKFEKILVTTDFSDNAAAAYPYAKAFVRKAGSSVHLLHILSTNHFDDDENGAGINELRKERLKLTAKEAFHDIGDKVTYDVEMSADSPHEAIYKHVMKHNYNLVIMATVGRTGINYLMMGSTTANVVRHVNTAVLSINPRRGEE